MKKKEKNQIDQNACKLGEATVAEWVLESFYRIKPSLTLVQYE